MKYRYDRDLERVKKELSEQARFERKIKQVCFCAIIVICVVVADAIAGSF
jgi:hypothetical protein